MKVSSSPEQPETAAIPIPETPTTTPIEVPAPTREQPVGQWPKWVQYADYAILLLLMVAAFLVASHVARNSDQWLHYASGRGLLKGEYSFGTDPFSHATEGRTWVNHNWLFGVLAYLLYNADTTGFVIIVTKAFCFAAAFGIVNLIRKSQQPMWPWLLVTCLGILASAPHSGLRPIIASGLFLAVTLWLLIGCDWKAHAKRNLILLGIVFWLWASFDTWFILGPLCVLLTLIGEFVQKSFFSNPTETAEEADAIPLATLGRALLVGIVACTLTPNHVRVWELPHELGLSLPASARTDEELSLLLLSPRDAKSYWEIPARGRNLNGLAFLSLLAGGGLTLAFTFNRVRISHVLLWMGFAALAFLNWRLILFFSIAAIPLIANGLSHAVDRIPLGTVDRPRTKLLMLLSSLGRILGFPAALLVAASAYPGWLHPKPGHAALSMKSSWAVEADVGLKRSAELLNQWRNSERLPENYNGLIANIEFSNHIAWFAPKVKVFANGRYRFHASELSDLIAARRLLLRRQQMIEQQEADDFHDLTRKRNIAYVAYCGTYSPPQPVEIAPILQLTTPNGGFSLWHVDGRMAVLGDRTSQVAQADPAKFRGLAFDPIRLAFHPTDVPPLPDSPEGTLRPPLGEPNFADDFLQDPPKLPPVDALDAEVWYYLGNFQTQMELQQQLIAGSAIANPELSTRVVDSAYKTSDTATAYRMLSLRAAYRGIATNPDDHQAYLTLSKAVEPGRFSLFGLNASIQQQIQVGGLRQFLDTVPPIQQIRPDGNLARSVIESSTMLAELYQPMNTGRRTVGLPEPSADLTRRAAQYWQRFVLPRLEQKEGEAKSKAIQQQITALEEMYAPLNESYLKEIRTKTDPNDQIVEALKRRLLLRAASLHTEHWRSVRRDVTLAMVQAYTALGKLNEADFHLRMLEEAVSEEQKSGKGGPELNAILGGIEQQRMLLWQLRGDFGKAGEAMDRTRFPTLPPDIKMFVAEAAKLPNADAYQAYMQLPPTYGAVLGATAGITTSPLNQQYLGVWRQQSSFFLGRAMMHLMEGKIEDAEIRFRQALKPEGIEVPVYLPERELADYYLRLIEKAKAPKP